MTLGSVERTETTTAVRHAATALPAELANNIGVTAPLTCCLRVPARTNLGKPKTT
jgi:hypothetical protein